MTWVVGLRSQAGPIEDSTIRNTFGNFLGFFFFFFFFGFGFMKYLDLCLLSLLKCIIHPKKKVTPNKRGWILGAYLAYFLVVGFVSYHIILAGGRR